MKWIPATALLAVMVTTAVPAYASSTPTIFTRNLRPTPDGFGSGGGTNNPAGCSTSSPENPTILLAALGLAGVFFGRKLKLNPRMRAVAAR